VGLKVGDTLDGIDVLVALVGTLVEGVQVVGERVLGLQLGKIVDWRGFLVLGVEVDDMGVNVGFFVEG